MILLLKDVLQAMEAKDPKTGQYLPFDLGYCTFSRQRNEGGKLIDYKGVTLTSDFNDVDKRKSTQAKREAAIADGTIVKTANPFHRKNKTRNITLPNGEIRKICFRFITSFNGNKVVY